MNYDNVAMRLLKILKRGQAVSGNENCKKVWKLILDAQEDSELYSRLGIVMGMPSQISQEVNDVFPTQYKLVNYIESRITSAFTEQKMNHEWNSFFKYIDMHTITYLEAIAELLETKNRNELLNNEKIIQVLDSLRNTCNEVLESDIDFDLKKYVLRKLRALISSIEEYQLTGIDSILDSLDSSIGHVHTNQEYRDFIQKTDLGKKVIEVLGMTANIVTVVAGVPQIGNSLQLLLDS